MRDTQLVMYEEDYRRIVGVVQRLVRDANAKGIFVVDRNGQLIAEAGEMRGIDTTSLASLTAGCIAATGGLAKLVGEDDFPVHFHQGQRDNLHITLVSHRIILVVVFDDRSSLGLVRLRVKKAGAELVDRVGKGEIEEVVLATNPNAEGDATAHFLIEALRPTGVRLSRIAFGMPLGGDLEYADHVTVGMSVENRRPL